MSDDRRITQPDDAPLLTVGDYRRVVAEMEEAEVRAARAEQYAKEQRQLAAEKRQKTEAFRSFADAMGINLPEERRTAPYGGEVESDGQAVRHIRNGTPTWTGTIEQILRDSTEGFLSYEELKSAVSKTELVEGDALNQKSFHRALGNLESHGVIVRHKQHAFTMEAFKLYEERVAAGRQDPVVPRNAHARGDTIGNRVCHYLADVGRAQSRDIVRHLQSDERFGPAARRNSNGVYNVLSRYVQKGLVGKDEATKEYWLLGPVEEHGGAE